jgi:hypothetical protein
MNKSWEQIAKQLEQHIEESTKMDSHCTTKNDEPNVGQTFSIGLQYSPKTSETKIIIDWPVKMEPASVINIMSSMLISLTSGKLNDELCSAIKYAGSALNQIGIGEAIVGQLNKQNKTKPRIQPLEVFEWK